MSGAGGAMQPFSQAEKGKALALLDSGMTLSEVASEIGANPATISKWVRQRKDGELRTTEVFEDAYNRQKDSILTQMLDLQSKCLQHAAATLEKASPYQAVMMAAILHDKMQLSLGNNPNVKSSVNIMVNNVSDEEQMRLMERVLKRAQKSE